MLSLDALKANIIAPGANILAAWMGSVRPIGKIGDKTEKKYPF